MGNLFGQILGATRAQQALSSNMGSNGSSPFLALMQSSAPGVGIAPEAVGEDIMVNRARDVPQPNYTPMVAPEDAGPIPLSNRAFVEELRDAERKLPPRKGIFGIKGTLRDVIGALGDNYLMSKGAKPMYAPLRQRERMADALAGFTQNPTAAIERAVDVDPEAAFELFKTVGTQQAAQAKARADAATAGQSAFKEGSRLFGQYSGAIARDPRLAKQLGPVMERVRAVYGLPPEDFPIPGEQDVDLAAGFQYGGTPTQAQLSDIRKGETIEQRERLETMKEEGRTQRTATQEAGRNRRDNPPARVNALERVRDKIIAGQKLTPGEQRLYEDSVPKSRGRGRGRKATTGSAGSPAGWGKAVIER